MSNQTFPLKRSHQLRAAAVAFVLLSACWAMGLVPGGILPTHADEGLPTADTCAGSRQCEEEVRDTKLCERQVALINELNQAIRDYEKEILNSRQAVVDMKRVLAESRKPGGAAPDPKRLKAQGIGMYGAVGAGNAKGPHIREAIDIFESVVNFQHGVNYYHYENLRDYAANRKKELKKLIAARKKELGLGENDNLPKAEQEALDRAEGPIEMMAMGRANYLFEIDRSNIFIGQLEGYIKQAKQKIENLKRTSPPNCDTETPTSDTTSSRDGSGTGESSDGSGGSGPAGPRSAADGGSGGSTASCPIAQTYAYAPGAVIVPKPADLTCGAPCPPLSGWSLPNGTRCIPGAGNPQSPGPADCPSGQHWSKDLGRCHASN